MRLVGFLRKNSTNPNDKDNLLRLFEYTDNFDRVNYLAKHIDTRKGDVTIDLDRS